MLVNLILVDETRKHISLPWQAETCGVPGLCVHKAHTQEDGGYIPLERSPKRFWWVITHVSSGIMVMDMIQTRVDAQRLARKLGSLNWTIPASEIWNSPHYGKLVKSVAERYFEQWQ